MKLLNFKMNEEKAAVVTFKKRKRKKGKKRKLKTDDGKGVENETEVKIPTSKRKSASANVSTTSKRPRTETSLAITSDRDAKALVESRGSATALDESETAKDRDATALLKRNIALNESGEADDGKTYRGQSGYKSYIKKDMSRIGANKHTGTQGPLRRPSFLRSTIRVDYQPDVCKDYKLTGSCGWGDTCIYLHDRGDYKKGWQLEKEWEMKKRKEEAKRRGESVDDSDEDGKYVVDSDEDDMPFACAICKEEFTTQRKVIVTNCNHYFHQDCVMRRYRKGKIRCVVCKKNTGGVFNAALKLQAKLKEKEKRMGIDNSGGGGVAPGAVTV